MTVQESHLSRQVLYTELEHIWQANFKDLNMVSFFVTFN